MNMVHKDASKTPTYIKVLKYFLKILKAQNRMKQTNEQQENHHPDGSGTERDT